MSTYNEARVYVSTYAKYNNGNLRGEWVRLGEFTCENDFHDRCLEIHSDEKDPEIMLQDFENFPKKFYSESNISPEVFHFLALDERDREICEVYWEHIDKEAPKEDALEYFSGEYESETQDFVHEFVEEIGLLHDVPDTVKMYFDYDAYLRDLKIDSVYVVRLSYNKIMVFNRN